MEPSEWIIAYLYIVKFMMLLLFDAFEYMEQLFDVCLHIRQGLSINDLIPLLYCILLFMGSVNVLHINIHICDLFVIITIMLVNLMVLLVFI